MKMNRRTVRLLSDLNYGPCWCAICGLHEGEYMACGKVECGSLMTMFQLAILKDFESLIRQEERFAS